MLPYFIEHSAQLTFANNGKVENFKRLIMVSVRLNVTIFYP